MKRFGHRWWPDIVALPVLKSLRRPGTGACSSSLSSASSSGPSLRNTSRRTSSASTRSPPRSSVAGSGARSLLGATSATSGVTNEAAREPQPQPPSLSRSVASPSRPRLLQGCADHGVTVGAGSQAVQDTIGSTRDGAQEPGLSALGYQLQTERDPDHQEDARVAHESSSRCFGRRNFIVVKHVLRRAAPRPDKNSAPEEEGPPKRAFLSAFELGSLP